MTTKYYSQNSLSSNSNNKSDSKRSKIMNSFFQMNHTQNRYILVPSEQWRK